MLPSSVNSASASSWAIVPTDSKKEIITNVIEEAQRDSRTQHPERSAQEHKLAAARALATLCAVNRELRELVEDVRKRHPDMEALEPERFSHELLQLFKNESILAAVSGWFKSGLGKPGNIEQELNKLIRKSQHLKVPFSELLMQQRNHVVRALIAISEDDKKTDLRSLELDCRKVNRYKYYPHDDLWQVKDHMNTVTTIAMLSHLAALCRNNRDLEIILKMSGIALDLSRDPHDGEFNPFDPDHSRIKALATAIEDGANVVSLDLSDNRVGEQFDTRRRVQQKLHKLRAEPDQEIGMAILARALKNCTSIRSLDLSNNDLKHAILALAGNFPPFLAELRLGHNDLEAGHMRALAPSLPRSLQTLGLEGTRLDAAEDRQALAQVLRESPSLTSLDLSYTRLNSSDAMAELVMAMPERLAHLNLALNFCGLPGEHPIIDALSRLTSLTSLDLSGNYISDAFIDDFIAHVLPNMPHLADLNLGLNSGLSNASIQKLAPYLADLKFLTHLGVDTKHLDNQSRAALTELKNANPRLTITDASDQGMT